jgi:hypothetical protein
MLAIDRPEAPLAVVATKGDDMDLAQRFAPRRVAHAHCDIPCGVYDPAQARIEAESCYRIIEKYPDLHDVCWKASKQASQVKRTLDIAEAQKLLELIDRIDEMWKGTGGPATTRLPS